MPCIAYMPMIYIPAHALRLHEQLNLRSDGPCCFNGLLVPRMRSRNPCDPRITAVGRTGRSRHLGMRGGNHELRTFAASAAAFLRAPFLFQTSNCNCICTFKRTFVRTFGPTFAIGLSFTLLKRWITSALLARLGAQRRFLRLARHAPVVEDAIAGDRTDARSLELMQQLRNLVGRAPGHAGELLGGHGFAIQLQKPPARAFVHQAKHVYPQSTRSAAHAAQLRIFHPVSDVEHQGRSLAHGASLLGFMGWCSVFDLCFDRRLDSYIARRSDSCIVRNKHSCSSPKGGIM